MKLIEFLAQANKKSFWTENRVVCFSGEKFPLLFFRNFFDFLKEKEILKTSNLDVQNQLELWKTLQQSFLGETSFYWLGNIVEKLKSKKRNKKSGDVVEVLSLYRGPHSIAFFLSEDHKISVSAKKRTVFVELSDTLTFLEVTKIFSFFDFKLTEEKGAIVREIVKNSNKISLDVVCMFIDYLSVTSLRFSDQLKKNLSSIVEPELSLFSLSKAFFTKQDKKFFSLWAECCNDYTVPFWVVYWSEQLWRAYHVTKFLKQNNFPAARRFSFRLPSSFLKGDWRYCSPEKLKQSFSMLYDIDFNFKTGSQFCSLDLFYFSYFLRKNH